MPQMSPLPWLSLFLMFILLILVSSSLNYFFFSPKITFSSDNMKQKIFNWKW